jgi:5'-nucleotidase / UDP-sugar diphosphatase
MTLLRLLFIILFALACAPKYNPEKNYHLTLLHTNDHHGRFWHNQNGEWGLAARSTLIKKIRKEVKEQKGLSLLLDAGDVNTGVPQSDMLKAEPDFKGMSKLDYDAMAVGNHEFDNEIAVIRQQEKWAGFPFLSANIYYKNQRMFAPYLIKEIDGLKIAIIGLTTLDTPFASKFGANPDLVFTDPILEAKKLVPELKKKAHVIIALTHMGHYPNEKHGSNSPGDVTLARQVDGIDLIIGGHTQLPLYQADVQNNTIIVQAYEWGKYLGRVDLIVKNKQVTLKRYELIPINHKDQGEKIAEDENIKNFLRPYKEQGDKVLLIDVGYTPVKLEGDRHKVRFQETNLGFHIAESFRQKFKADIGLTNSGGVRDSIAPGKITYETVLTVLPFSNDIATVEMKGTHLQDYLKKLLTKNLPGGGGLPQSAGLSLEFDIKTQKFKTFLIGGKPLNRQKTYKIALPTFVAFGNDNWPDLTPLNPRIYGFVDAQIFREYLENNNPLPVMSNQARVKVEY